MPKKNLRVSIVIPAYNEQDHLVACLQAISKQTVKPYEVIVVDNNSSDNTAAIAKSFDFVTLLHERRQGVVYARDLGFDAAGGDIIGRIDADTILPLDWTSQVQKIFSESHYGAVTGSVHYYDAPLARVIDGIDLACRKWLAPHLGDYVYLLGSNMALSASAWRAVRSSVCHGQKLHEDEDLAIHLGKLGYKVGFIPELHAAVSGRAIDTSPLDFWHYAYANVYTYKQHRISEVRAMYPIVILILICYLPLRILYRGFDERSRRFAWRRILTPHVLGRVNPTTFLVVPD